MIIFSFDSRKFDNKFGYHIRLTRLLLLFIFFSFIIVVSSKSISILSVIIVATTAYHDINTEE